MSTAPRIARAGDSARLRAFVSRTSLPAYQTAFVGRAAEMQEIRAALTNHRAVALVGPPGVGKTRLAIELAKSERSIEVPLRGVRNARALIEAFAASLDLRSPDGDEAQCARKLGEWLADREPSLVLLDTAEGLDDLAIETVRAIRSHTIAHSWLSTSQRAIEGETNLAIGPLPPHDARLLLESRASCARGGAPIDPSERGELDEIARRLDRLPLSIELAASRLAVLSASELLDRLERHRSLGERETLERTIDWAIGLLEPWQRRGLAQATAFAGGFDLDAAEAVLEVGGHCAVDFVRTMVERSLFAVRRSPGKPGRFSIFEAVERQAEKLLAPDERAALVARHAAYFAELASSEPAPNAAAWKAARDRMARERENFALAEARAKDPETIATLILGQEPERFGTGTFAEERARLQRALDRALEAGSAVLAVRAEIALGRFLRLRGLLPDARLALESGETRARENHLQRAHTIARVELARLLVDEGRTDEAELEACVRVAAEQGDDLARADALVSLGIVALHKHDRELAETRWQHALALYERTGDVGGQGTAIANLGAIARLRGDFDVAREAFARAASLQHSIGNLRGEGIALGNLANVERQRGEHARSRELFARALRIHHYVGNERSIVLARCFLGQLETACGNYEDADRELRAARALGEAVLPWADRAQILEAMADLEEARGDLARAERTRASARTGGAPETVLVIGKGGAWLERHGHARIVLGRRQSARRVLLALASHRIRSPGASLSLGEVVAAGWPGEKMIERAARQRVYVLINTMRKLGVSELETTDDGYRLDPKRSVRIEPD
jgi:predicted ATPase